MLDGVFFAACECVRTASQQCHHTHTYMKHTMQRKLAKEIEATEKLTRNARQEVGQLQQRLLVSLRSSFRVNHIVSSFR